MKFSQQLMHIIIEPEVQLVWSVFTGASCNTLVLYVCWYLYCWVWIYEKDTGDCDSGSESCDETPCGYGANHLSTYFWPKNALQAFLWQCFVYACSEINCSYMLMQHTCSLIPKGFQVMGSPSTCKWTLSKKDHCQLELGCCREAKPLLTHY